MYCKLYIQKNVSTIVYVQLLLLFQTFQKHIIQQQHKDSGSKINFCK